MADGFNNLADCGTNLAAVAGFEISPQDADKGARRATGAWNTPQLSDFYCNSVTAFEVGKSAIELCKNGRGGK